MKSIRRNLLLALLGTMCAAMLQGLDLVEACRRANAASAVTISHESALPVPTPEQIQRVLEVGRVVYSY